MTAGDPTTLGDPGSAGHRPRAIPQAGFDIPLRVRFYIAAALLVMLVGVPAWGSTILILRATEVAVFAVAFSGLHILSGHLGLISVGHGAFIGIGAMGAAHAIDDLSVPYLLAPLAGAVCGAAFGALIGVPSLRLPGTYLALLTLAMAMVLPIGMRQIDGPLGYRVDGDIRPPSWSGLTDAESSVWQYILVVVVGSAIVAVLHLAIRGRFTRSLIAARDEPTAAAAFGVQVSQVRLIGVALSAGLAGAAGGLRLYATPLVAGAQYPFRLSVSMFALMLALGASRLWTSVPAAVILVMLPHVLTDWGLPVWEPVIYALILLTMTRVSRGQGLVALLERYRNTTGVRSLSNQPTDGMPAEGSGKNPFLLTPEPRSRS